MMESVEFKNIILLTWKANVRMLNEGSREEAHSREFFKHSGVFECLCNLFIVKILCLVGILDLLVV